MSAEYDSEHAIEHDVDQLFEHMALRSTKERMQLAAFALRDVVIREQEARYKQDLLFGMYVAAKTSVLSDDVAYTPQLCDDEGMDDDATISLEEQLFQQKIHELSDLDKARIAVVGAVDSVQVTHLLTPRRARKALAMSRRNGA